ncbi:hypothetical protein F8388_004878 [Cannabis sativa]|uniref:CASP-like protein n=1 Tax=Cannabis sativa TaxID=3483 RepID=A0A7J6HRH6_CANSA|nr:hypothetical protein F8388_004878 [Cannabis sativa]
MAIADFVLRLGGIIAALSAAATMGTSDESLPFFTQFFLIAMALVSGYLVLSLPFSIVTIVALTLATSAAAAAAAIVYLAHNGNASSNWLAICNQFTDFCQNVSGAVVAAFVSVVVFICLILLSALFLRKH